jgi:hypothetical protein
MKVSKCSRRPVALLSRSRSVWSTPSIGRSSGTLPPANRANVGKKSMIENIAYDEEETTVIRDNAFFESRVL